MAARRTLRFLHPEEAGRNPETVLSACCVIVMRRFKLAGPILALCRRARIPCYYFTDENVVALSTEDRGWRRYGHDWVRRQLAGFAGVICGSAPLADYFRSTGLHPQVAEWAPVLPRDPPPMQDQPDPPTCFAFIGGAFRWRALAGTVLPGLAAAAKGSPLRLLLRNIPDHRIEPGWIARAAAAGVSIAYYPDSERYDRFVETVRAERVQVVLHPAGDSRNIDYKSLATIVAARAIGALPILPDQGVFPTLGEAEGILVLPDRPEAWTAALDRLLREPGRARLLRQRFDAHCRAAYRGERTVAFLEELVERHRVDAATRARRLAAFRARPHLPYPIRREFWRAIGL